MERPAPPQSETPAPPGPAERWEAFLYLGRVKETHAWLHEPAAVVDAAEVASLCVKVFDEALVRGLVPPEGACLFFSAAGARVRPICVTSSRWPRGERLSLPGHDLASSCRHHLRPPGPEDPAGGAALAFLASAAAPAASVHVLPEGAAAPFWARAQTLVGPGSVFAEISYAKSLKTFDH